MENEANSSHRLPEVLPVFPLEGALLLPHGHLPLHIFEPRYRAMIEAALGAGRVIGMIQPKGTFPQPTPDDAELFGIGCAGKIVSLAETDDGRFFVTLKGLCRFRIMRELPVVGGFRRVLPDFSGFVDDFATPDEFGVDRERLMQTARLFLDAKGIGCDWTAAEAAPMPALVTTFAMTCPFEPREKQALLECSNLAERSELMISLFEMALLTGDGQASGAQH